MAKPLYVYTGSQWVPVASELESTSQYATTTYVNDKVGLDYISTVTGSAVSAINLNNVFSSTYRNYRIIVTGLLNTGAQNLQFRLRVGGVDNSTANSYQSQSINGASTTLTGTRTTSTFAIAGGIGSTQNNITTIDLSDPFQASATSFNGHSSYVLSGNIIADVSTGFHNQAVSYDGITIFPSGGTITARVQVYGYKD